MIKFLVNLKINNLVKTYKLIPSKMKLNNLFDKNFLIDFKNKEN